MGDAANKVGKVVLIGFDACDPAIAMRMARSGEMPNLAKLMKDGARAPVKNPNMLIGGIWVNFQTALKTENHGFACWEEVDPQTYEYREKAPEIGHLPAFWDAVSDAGKKIAVIDVPHDVIRRPVNGIQLVEWGMHDRHYGFHTSPPELAEQVEQRFGTHAVFGINAHEARHFASDDDVHRKGRYRTTEEDKALIDDMVDGLRRKLDLVKTLMAEDDYDLFVTVLAECHGIGHQQWHLHDPAHPEYDAARVAAIGGDPLKRIYAETDKFIGGIMDQVSENDLLLVHFSHGMGPRYDGSHLLEDILIRLESAANGDNAVRKPARPGFLKRLAMPYIPRLQAIARRMHVPGFIRRAVGKGVVDWGEAGPEGRAKRRFFLQPNNTVYGGIRLNIKGREARGRIDPADVDELVAQIEKDLLEIVNVETGKHVVNRVERSDQWHERRPDDTLPDLFVDWDRHAVVNTVYSPKIGTISVPFNHWRTGDHLPAAMIFARGSGYEGGARLPSLKMEDIGPSIAARFGINLQNVDGKPADWLAQGGVSSADRPSSLKVVA